MTDSPVPAVTSPPGSDPTVLAAIIARLQDEMGRIESLRSNNRQVTIVVVGTLIGFIIQAGKPALILTYGIGALVIGFLFWFQDYRFHRYRHGWNEVDRRLRQYLRGEIAFRTTRLLEYDSRDEKGAEFFALSSSFTFLIMIAGCALTTLLRLFSAK